ncbi:MAG: membrane protein insertion efficiency factor YidD [Thermodesulfovibrionales bacterium]|nr:membrane protein insertion efficiency factor YidD [Thermodesulfovibrionales bacterium]
MGFVIKKIIVLAIDVYRAAVSPFLPSSCRFQPSCSAYSKEALQKYGAVKGLLLSAKRVFKCHPFHPGGYDPVK